MKKRYLKLIAGLMCFKNVQPISHYSWAIFSASRIKALLILKDLQPNGPDKATYLTNHKKTGLAIFGKKKTTGLVCDKYKRKGCLDVGVERHLWEHKNPYYGCRGAGLREEQD